MARHRRCEDGVGGGRGICEDGEGSARTGERADGRAATFSLKSRCYEATRKEDGALKGELMSFSLRSGIRGNDVSQITYQLDLQSDRLQLDARTHCTI